MGQVLYGCATTRHAVRAALQRSKAPLKDLAVQHGLNPKIAIAVLPRTARLDVGGC